MTVDKETSTEILRLYHAEKWKIGTIARQLGLHHSTVRRVLRDAEDAAQDEQVGQHVDNIRRGELAPDPDGQALAGELVQDVEHAEGPAVICPVMDEVVGPDVVRPLGAQPDAGAVVEP